MYKITLLHITLFIVAITILSSTSFAQKLDESVVYSNNDSSTEQATKFYTDWVFARDGELGQTLYSQVPSDTILSITVSCSQLTGDDTLVCYTLFYKNLPFKKGVSSRDLNIEYGKNKNTNQDFLNIVKDYGVIPPGKYFTELKISTADSCVVFNAVYYQDVDSILEIGSSVRQKVNNFFSPQKNKLFATSHSPSAHRQNVKLTPLSRNELLIVNSRFSKRNNVLKSVPIILSGKNYMAIYYREWFLGYYEVYRGKQMKNKISQERQRLQNGITSSIKKDFDNINGLTSEFKKQYSRDNKKDQNGYIDVFSNWANDQEPGSQQDNNYQEYRGVINTDVLGIPVSIEGFYTSQDKGRIAKASYLRLHYNVDKTRSDIEDGIGTYKSKFRDATSQSGIYEYATQAFISKCENAIAAYYNDLLSEYGLSKEVVDMHRGDVVQIAKDSTVHVDVDKLKKNKKEIEGKYAEVKKLQAKISKYNRVVEQYKDGLYFDSALVYDKISKVNKGKSASTKDLAKSAVNMFPDGKTKKILSGLTSLDIGLLNEYESNYTMSGQMLKGGKVGYDFNLVKATMAMGKTEYVSRAGYLDRYNSTMLRLDFKQYRQQKLGVIYYLNSPTKQVFESDNFKDGVSIPTYQDPIHVFSLLYDGKVNKDLSIKAEVANSQRKSNHEMTIGLDNMAILASIDYKVPKTLASLFVEWEHVGKKFENNTLPYLRSAIDRYAIKGETFLFRSFLKLGVQYNLMKQSTFSSTGYNRKWGFDIRTRSKRYPNVYISYKPYSTFRSYTDTFAVQQRPMVGEVWVARGNYSIRSKHHSHSFAAIFNKNSSTFDTSNYKSNTAQLMYIYTSKKSIINTSLGWMSVPSVDNGDLETYFANAGISRMINEQLYLSFSQDIAFASFGLQRLSSYVAGEYALSKLPLKLRLQLKYGSYKSLENMPFTKLWGIGVGVNFYFENKN